MFKTANSADRSPRKASLAFTSLLSLTLVLGFVSACSDDDGDASSSTTSIEGAAPGSGDTESDGGGSTSSTGDANGGDETPGSTLAEVLPSDEWPDLTTEEQRYADAVIDDLGPEDQPAILPGADNACLAVHWVDAIGEEALLASGLTPEEFVSEGPPAVGIDRATAEVMIDSMESCGAPLDQFYAGWALTFGVDPEADPEIVECMQEALSVEEFRESLVASFTGEKSDEFNAAQKELEACLPREG